MLRNVGISEQIVPHVWRIVKVVRHDECLFAKTEPLVDVPFIPHLLPINLLVFLV